MESSQGLNTGQVQDVVQEETKDKSEKKERHHRTREDAGSPGRGEDGSGSTAGRRRKSKSGRRKHQRNVPDNQVGSSESPLSVISDASGSRDSGPHSPLPLVSTAKRDDATKAATEPAKDDDASHAQQQHLQPQQSPPRERQEPLQRGQQQEQTAGQDTQTPAREEPQQQSKTPPAGQEVQARGQQGREPRKLAADDIRGVIPHHWRQEALTDKPRQLQPRQVAKRETAAEQVAVPPDGEVIVERPRNKSIPRELSLLPNPMAVFVVFLMAFFGVPLSVLVFQAFPKSKPRCVSEACIGVLEYMDVIVDKRVAPCHDFYRHVCGHWLANDSMPSPAPSSFMADVLHNYTSLRHRKLMARQELNEPADYVAHYYHYCVDYLSVKRGLEEILNELFKVTDIKPKAWLNMSSNEVFARLLHLSYIYRVHGLISVSVARDPDNVTLLEVHRPTSFKGHFEKAVNGSGGAAYLESVLKAIGGVDVTDAITKECLSLDDTVAQQERPGLPPAPVSESECADFPPRKWIMVTNFDSGVASLPDNTKVVAEGYNDTCRNLRSVLLSQVPQVRVYYSLALLAATFLKLDFAIASGSAFGPDLVEKVCHSDTWATFGLFYADALTEVLSISPKAARSAEAYFSAFKEAAEDSDGTERMWMTDEDRRAMIARAKALQVSTFENRSSIISKEAVGTRFDASFGMRAGQWIYNKVNVMMRSKIADDVDSFSRSMVLAGGSPESYETELSANAKLNLVYVPQMFALPPVFFEEVSEANYANVALLGVQMARGALPILLNGSVGPTSWSQKTLTAYQELRKCYANNSMAFHGQLEDEQFDEAIVAAMAIRYAFLSRTHVSPPSEEMFLSQQLFFRRACLSLCAGGKERADSNSLDRDTASAACTLGVSGVPAFHETFRCTNVDPMALPRTCKF